MAAPAFRENTPLRWGYVNLRPFVAGPSALNDGVDMLVVRENTEGTYAGEGGFLRHGTAHEVATQGSVNTRMGVERCIRFAFELARSRERRHCTLVHKTNVLTFAGDLWQRAFNDVAKEFPGVGTAYNHVDAACIYFVQDPHRYDVIVTDNLFGDMLSDEAAQLTGSLGMLPSASLGAADANGKRRAAEFLSYVEAIPMEVLETIDVDWETIPEYMDKLDKRLGVTTVTDAQGALLGIVSDGDFKRILTDMVIEGQESHNKIADQLLNDDRVFAVMQGMLAKMVYQAFAQKRAH
mgnify:CR=1 FL=1